MRVSCSDGYRVMKKRSAEGPLEKSRPSYTCLKINFGCKHWVPARVGVEDGAGEMC